MKNYRCYEESKYYDMKQCCNCNDNNFYPNCFNYPYFDNSCFNNPCCNNPCKPKSPCCPKRPCLIDKKNSNQNELLYFLTGLIIGNLLD